MAERGEGLRANRAASRAFQGRIAHLREAEKVDRDRAEAQAKQAAAAGPERRPSLDAAVPGEGETYQYVSDAPETELIDPEQASAMSAHSVTTDPETLVAVDAEAPEVVPVVAEVKEAKPARKTASTAKKTTAKKK
jgi:Rieske Fe-S protein